MHNEYKNLFGILKSLIFYEETQGTKIGLRMQAKKVQQVGIGDLMDEIARIWKEGIIQ